MRHRPGVYLYEVVQSGHPVYNTKKKLGGRSAALFR